ncbi:chemotaxis protein CheB [Rhodanobacter sp. BL-MT-08]
MSQAAPAVALLFDDVELGGHLRDALSERGARIVHEGGMASLTRDLLQRVGAQVLVVNLDDSADDALDRLYEVIDGNQTRVVFNDAQASRALTGWDRARWARHLAVKVLEMGDLDPPRPEHARGVEVINSDVLEAAIAREAAAEFKPAPAPDLHEDADARFAAPSAEHEHEAVAPQTPAFAPEQSASTDDDTLREPAASEQSEDLAAELEALLAAGDLSVEEEEPTGSGLRFTGDEELPPLHDGHFGPPAGAQDEADMAESPGAFHVAAADKALDPGSVTPPVFQLDHLELAPLTDTTVASISAAAAQQIPVDALAAQVRAPDSWSLLDEEDAPASTEQAAAADFGIHKVSAADFLAPDAEHADADDEAIMSLQLISMEEAVAPTAFEEAEAFRANSLSQIVLLGAAAGSTDSVCGFLSALPPTSRLAFVLTQHLGETPVDTLVDALAQHSSLPVRAAKHGARAKVGEVLVVPAGQQLILIRDGSIELMPNGANAAQGPSIDASFSMAANVFGRDALAIVFAGRGTDAVAGAQAVHDRGGKVWVESSANEHSADMVSGISAERLVSFSGTPHELAAHLIEVFP